MSCRRAVYEKLPRSEAEAETFRSDLEMFDGITEERVVRMSEQEKRWFDNVKKAFCESDHASAGDAPDDHCLQELFKAIDTAKTLRRSLRGEDTSPIENKKRFIHFLGLEIPCARPRENIVQVRDRTTGTLREMTFGEVLYDIRCKIHENENLNAAEEVDHHILIDWSRQHPRSLGRVKDETFICEGFFVWDRLRQVLSKFVTGLDSMVSFARDGSFSITIEPELGSIRPVRKKREGH